MKRRFWTVFAVAAVVGTTWVSGTALAYEDFIVDDGSAEIWTGASNCRCSVKVNRFVPGRAVMISSISFNIGPLRLAKQQI